MGKYCTSCMHKSDALELKLDADEVKKSQSSTHAAINLAEGYNNYPSQHSGSMPNSRSDMNSLNLKQDFKVPKLKNQICRFVGNVYVGSSIQVMPPKSTFF